MSMPQPAATRFLAAAAFQLFAALSPPAVSQITPGPKCQPSFLWPCEPRSTSFSLQLSVKSISPCSRADASRMLFTPCHVTLVITAFSGRGFLLSHLSAARHCQATVTPVQLSFLFHKAIMELSSGHVAACRGHCHV